MAEKKKKEVDKGKLVRVDTPIWEKVKFLTEATRQSIGGFFSLAAEKEFEKQKPKNQP